MHNPVSRTAINIEGRLRPNLESGKPLPERSARLAMTASDDSDDDDEEWGETGALLALALFSSSLSVSLPPHSAR